MRRLVNYLAPAGLLVLVATQIPRIAEHLPGKREAWLAGGALLVLAHLLARWEDIANLVGRRQLLYGGNALLFGLAGLGILILVNWIVYNYKPMRLDLTKNRRYSLSEQTRKVVGELKEDVKVTHFFVGDPEAQSQNETTRERLHEYQALSSRIKVENVDARKEPARARAGEIKAVPTLVFELGGKKETTSATGEQDITKVLIKLTREGKKTACFLKGDAERDADDSSDRGYSQAKAALERSQYETLTISFAREAKVPEACSVVVVAGPERDLQKDAVDVLRRHVSAGGKALVLLEPEFKEPTPNLSGLLKEWNLEVGHDIVLELYQQLTESGLVRVASERVVIDQYPFHEITKAFPLNTAFQTVRSLKAVTGGTGPRAENLLESSSDSWAKSDLSLKPPLRFDEKADKKGPVAIGAVATVGAPGPSPEPSPSPEGEAPKKPEGRVAAFGDSDFASNALLRFGGNQDFFLNVVAWLADDADLISIRPRDPDDHRLSLDARSLQYKAVLVLGLFATPLLFLVLGVVNWWKQR